MSRNLPNIINYGKTQKPDFGVKINDRVMFCGVRGKVVYIYLGRRNRRIKVKLDVGEEIWAKPSELVVI